MTYQPFLTKLPCGPNKSITYVRILFDDESNDYILKIIVTDIKHFSKEFRVKSESHFADLTFQINSLSLDDINIVDSIFNKLKHFESSFKPYVQENNDVSIDLSNTLNDITIFNKDFKYTFPLNDMNEIDELRIIKEIYSNIEKFSSYQNNLIDILSNQIINKDQIINKLSFSYYEKINPINNKPDNLNDILSSKVISRLFINKRILNYFQTNFINLFYKSTENLNYNNIFDSKWSIIWNKTIGNNVQIDEGLENDNNNKPDHIEISEFGEDNEENKERQDEKNHKFETHNLPTTMNQPKVKRKLQGILRRNNKRNKTTKEN